MKNTTLSILILLLMVPICAQGQNKTPLEVLTLKEKDIIDFEEKLDENEVFYRILNGLDTDDQGHLYYLEGHYVTIYKVQIGTGKLVKTISRKGQGPSELNKPISMRVKYGKIFIYDFWFPGVKIFDLEGKIVKEFRLKNPGIYGLKFFLKNIIDANDQQEIYLRDIDEENNTVISVFNLNGKVLRKLIPINADREKDVKQWVLNTDFNFQLDKDGNIVVLYIKKGFLKKFDKNGKLLWERDLYTDLPNEDKNEEKFEVKHSKKVFQVSYKLDFIGFCITDTNDIFVSTFKGGISYDTSGKPRFILKQPSGEGFGPHLVWSDGKLFTPTKMHLVKNLNKRSVK